MNNKFNIGDKVYNVFLPHIGGFITEIYERPDLPPASWVPNAANNYTPTKMPNICMYKVEGHNMWLFEYTIKLDKEYYKMINRDNKLKELDV